MRTLFKKGLLAASVAAALFLGGIPDMGGSWGDGMSAVGQAYAAGGKGRGGGSSGGHSGGGGSSHSDGGHDDHDHDDGGHDDSHDHDDSDGKKGKGPRYRGGRDASSAGKGGPGREVVEKIFENE